MEWLIRFLIGGTVVSLFALLGDVLRPRSLAGVFGAAPSVALGTLALTLHSQGDSYAATEARSMVIGAAATVVYAWVCAVVLWKRRTPVPAATLGALAVWLAAALGGWLLLSSLIA